MFGLQFEANHRVWFFAALLFPGVSMPSWISAEEIWLSGKAQVLDLDLDQMETMGLLPVGLLDDESLLELADAWRSRHNEEPNLINIYWLMGSNLDEGKFRAQFRQNLSRLILNYFEARFYRPRQENKEAYSSRDEHYAHRYRLKLSDDQVSLNYIIPF